MANLLISHPPLITYLIVRQLLLALCAARLSLSFWALTLAALLLIWAVSTLLSTAALLLLSALLSTTSLLALSLLSAASILACSLLGATLSCSLINDSDYLMLLDEHGSEFRSIEFAEMIQRRMSAGTKRLVFVIGDPYGFSDAVYQRSNIKLSLSKMTFSHQIVSAIFTEQLYRAFTILKNEPYHRE